MVNFWLNCFPSEPNSGPAKVFSAYVNKTTLNISWAPLPREQSNGGIILYYVKEELLSRGKRLKKSPLSSKTFNTTNTFILLRGLLLLFAIPSVCSSLYQSRSWPIWSTFRTAENVGYVVRHTAVRVNLVNPKPVTTLALQNKGRYPKIKLEQFVNNREQKRNEISQLLYKEIYVYAEY